MHSWRGEFVKIRLRLLIAGLGKSGHLQVYFIHGQVAFGGLGMSRNVSFIFSLRNSEVDFVACDIPDANRAIADRLNQMEYRTRRGQEFLAMSVTRLDGKL